MKLEAYVKAEPIVTEIRNLDKMIAGLEAAEMKMGTLSWNSLIIQPSTQNAMLSAMVFERACLVDRLDEI